MKIKLNKEQVSYLNSLTDKEAKKEFLFDCFIESCEACLVEEPKEIIFKDGLFKTSDPLLSSWMANCSFIMKLFKEDSNKPKIEYVDPIDAETLQKMKNLEDPYGSHQSTKKYAIQELKHIAPEWAKTSKIVTKEDLLNFDLPKVRTKAINEVLNDNPSLESCIEMKNYCAKIGEYELCAKFRDKEKQLLEKNPPKGESLSKEQLKDITQPKHNIEDVVFSPVGEAKYRFKLVLINHPAQNVHGLTNINGAYYEKIFV